MARLGLATSGKSLGWVEGYAHLSIAKLGYIVRRGALTVVSIAGLLAGLAAASAAIEASAYAGVESEPVGGAVTVVEPTGYAWATGIRVGQRVLLQSRSDDPAGARITTTDGSRFFAVEAVDFDNSLRATLPLGIAALGFAYLGVMFLRTRRRWVLPTAAAALLAASVPLRAQGVPDVSTTVLAAALLVPAGSITTRLPGGRWVRATLSGALLAFLGAWLVGRLTGADAAPALEDLRGAIALLATAIIIGERVVVPALAGERVPVIRPRLFDVAAIAAFAAIALVLINVLQASPVIVGAVLLVAVAFLPATRRRIGRPIEAALLGDIREAAASDAAEAERARLARELHDVPLQELVAVIRRLEIVPGTETESENLRALASHLRNVATELRPPVLDDLGLPAAIDYLAEETTSAVIPVTADVVDDTGFGPDRRPPPAVELAVFRIASEAVGNAVRHSGGNEVTIRAAVAPDRVELIVADDGAGLDDKSARDASKQKRLGLASMRRRAQAIDAELSIDGSARGTQVRLVWQA
jgi:two-component system sensor histidine kinase DegS